MEENTTTKNNLIKKYGFTEADFKQISALGISLDKIEGELLLFKLGIPKITLEKPATINDGIVKLSNEEFQSYADFFDTKKFPKITFESEVVEFLDSSYVAKGNLTLLKETKPLEVPFKHLGAGKNDSPKGNSWYSANL